MAEWEQSTPIDWINFPEDYQLQETLEKGWRVQ